MRHLRKVKKLNKVKSHRDSMLKNLAASVIQYEEVKTTEAKAKAVSSLIDRIITVGKANDLNARRRLYMMLPTKLSANKVLDVLNERYKDRNSGFTSIVHIGVRKGDNSRVVKIRLID
jgi:large subunit ribosomal protein L17